MTIDFAQQKADKMNRITKTIREIMPAVITKITTFEQLATFLDGLEADIDNSIIGATTPAAGSFTTTDLTGALTADTINEHTGAAGVTIEGILQKDGLIQSSPINVLNSIDLARSIYDRCTDPRLIMVCDGVPGDELITNGQDWTGATGATPPTGWTTYINGEFTATADGGPSGTGDTSLKLEVDVVPNVNPGAYQSFTTVIGEQYTLGFWFKDDGTATGFLKIGTSANGIQYANQTLTDASWTYHQTTFTATTITTFVTMRTTSNIPTQYCEFDNITCTLTCPDYSSNGHNGTFAGAMTSGDRVYEGNCFVYDMDGSDDCINFGNDTDFSFDDSGAAPFTVGILSEIVSSSSEQTLISKYDGGNNTREWALTSQATEAVRMYFRDQSAAETAYVESSILSEGLHFIVHTYDGSGGNDADDGMNMYVDGVLDNSNKSGTVGYTAMEPATALLIVGAQLTNGIPVLFNTDTGAAFIDAAEWSAADIWSMWLEVKAKYGL